MSSRLTQFLGRLPLRTETISVKSWWQVLGIISIICPIKPHQIRPLEITPPAPEAGMPVDKSITSWRE
ncbi:MAG: hypothetical protein HQ588_05220 [Deltaproteobacteria bacterium]|nr:hypothetical protein [Deltaproteobacteria bacterium]